MSAPAPSSASAAAPAPGSDPASGRFPAFVSRPIGGAPLVKAYLDGDPAALALYGGGHPGDLSSYREKVREVAGRITRADRERLARVLTGGGAEREARLERFVEEGGFAVTTGQQPGVFGGPLFSVHKALTAAALAGRLEGALGVPVLPIFWVASEDHDWDEVRRLTVLSPTNDEVDIELAPPEGYAQAPLFRVAPARAAMDAALSTLLGALPETEFHPDLRAQLEGAYGAGATLPQAFAALMGAHLADAGVFILSPEAPEIQAARLPLLLAEAEGAEASEVALAAQTEAIEAAGFGPPQVPILEGGVNLFLEVEGVRTRVYRGDPATSFETLAERGHADPGALTPNVLLRPVVESALIPTLAYVAGPGELAYWGQLAPLFKRHGIRPPIAHPRWSGAILEGKIAKVLDKVAVEIADLATPLHELAAARARDDFPAAFADALGAARAQVTAGGDTLKGAIREVDPTLAATVDHFRNQALHLLSEVERKAMQAVKRAQSVEIEQIAKAQRHLFPKGLPQERVFPAVLYLVRYGPGLLDVWRSAMDEAVLPPSVKG
jgi:bacillithiol synthase